MGFLSNLFGKKTSEPIDFGVIGVDMHSHLIPGIDDGAKELDDSLNMIREFRNLGYRKLITTPHVMSDFYRNTPDVIHSGLDIVRNALTNTEDLQDMEVGAAAEYYIDAGFTQLLKEKNVLTFGKNYILVEVSYLNEPEGIDAILFNIQMAGYKPVLAHPERYPFWQMNMEKYREIIEKGALLQLNINSLSKHYGPGASKTSEKLIEEGLISFVGTDCHKLAHLELMQRVKTNPFLERLISSGKLLNNTL